MCRVCTVVWIFDSCTQTTKVPNDCIDYYSVGDKIVEISRRTWMNSYQVYYNICTHQFFFSAHHKHNCGKKKYSYFTEVQDHRTSLDVENNITENQFPSHAHHCLYMKYAVICLLHADRIFFCSRPPPGPSPRPAPSPFPADPPKDPPTHKWTPTLSSDALSTFKMRHKVKLYQILVISPLDSSPVGPPIQ